MGMIGIILFLVILAGAILYVRLKQGCFFKPRFKNDFPEELKPYMGKNCIVYGAWEIKPLVERYKEAKRKHFFSLERFKNEEEELMQAKKNRMW